MRKSKISELWTVRNKRGQLIARYYAWNAQGAIQRCLSDDQVQTSQFHSYSSLKIDDLVAAVETRDR